MFDQKASSDEYKKKDKSLNENECKRKGGDFGHVVCARTAGSERPTIRMSSSNGKLSYLYSKGMDQRTFVAKQNGK